MLKNNNNTADYFEPAAVGKNGMNGDEKFLIAGQGPEPQHVWDNENHRFTDEVSGFGIYLCQNIKVGNTCYKQNPIFVVFDGISEADAAAFKFGDEVKVTNLRGYYSRKKYMWRWRADAIEKAK